MKVFSGERLFKLKDTSGIPLDIALDKIINKEGLSVDWSEFINTAREHGRWDFQIFDEVKFGLEDAGVDKGLVNGILQGVKVFMQINKHPKMKE